VDLGAEGEGMDGMEFGAGGVGRAGGAAGEAVGFGDKRERSWERNCLRSAWVTDQSV